MRSKGFKIPVTMKQDVPFLNAARGDQGIDRIPYGDSLGPKRSKVLSCLNGCLGIDDIHHLKTKQQLPGLVEIPIAVKSLKHFCQDQVTAGKRLGPEQSIKQFHLWSCRPTKEIRVDTSEIPCDSQ